MGERSGPLVALGERAARMLRWGVRRAVTPVVHPWMTVEASRMRDLVTQLDGHLARFDAAADRTATLWPHGSLDGVAQVRAAVVLTRDAYAGLADALDRHGPPLRDAIAGLPDAATDPQRLRTLRGAVRSRTDALSAADVECRRRLEEAVRLVPDGPAVVAGVLALPTDSASQGRRGSRASPASPASRASRASRADGADARAVGDRAAAVGPHAAAGASAARRVTGADMAPAPPAAADEPATGDAPRLRAGPRPGALRSDATVSARQVRAALAPLPSRVVRAYVHRHPELVETLVASVDDLDLLPGGLSADLFGRHGADAGDVRRHIERRRAAFDAAPDEAVRAGLLWPALVGPLDGAGVEARVAANALLVRAELGRARRADVDLELRAIARRAADGPRRTPAIRRALLTAWLTRDAITSYVTTSTDLPLLERADLRVRILLYQGLLYDRVDDPARPAGSASPAAAATPATPVAPAGSAVPAVSAAPATARAIDRRRLLLFEPGGRGRLAELWGHLDQHTEALAVLVPGTGTAVRGFHLPTTVARELATALAPRRAAVIAWMGADFPLAIGSNAPFAHYALAAAAPLRDFVAGLPRPPRAALTVLGHSYGGTIVGAAECTGLDADRVAHIASPGAGPGVRGVHDYAPADPLGRARTPARYTLTAPGDPIRWVQRFEAPWHLLPRVVAATLRGRLGALSLGVDPERLAGIHVLPAGTWEVARGVHAVGTPVSGPAAHAAVMEPGTGAFRRLAEVIAAPP